MAAAAAVLEVLVMVLPLKKLVAAVVVRVQTQRTPQGVMNEQVVCRQKTAGVPAAEVWRSIQVAAVVVLVKKARMVNRQLAVELVTAVRVSPVA